MLFTLALVLIVGIVAFGSTGFLNRWDHRGHGKQWFFPVLISAQVVCLGLFYASIVTNETVWWLP